MNGSLGSFHSFDGRDSSDSESETENDLRDHMQLAKLSHSLYYFGASEDEDLQTDVNGTVQMTHFEFTESPATSKDSVGEKKFARHVGYKDDSTQRPVARSITRSDGRSYRSYEGSIPFSLLLIRKEQNSIG